MSRRPDAIECLLIAALVATTLLMGGTTILLTTSLIPFAAILSKRTTFDLAGIGWWRLLLTVAIYLGLVWLHPFILGEDAWPGLG